MSNRRLILVLALLAGLTLTAACASGEDDDDNDDIDSGDDDSADDDSGDDDSADDDSGDDDTADTTPPTISGTTYLGNTHDDVGPYPVSATITDDVGVVGAALLYRVDGGDFVEVPMTADGDLYSAAIPGQAGGSDVECYLRAWDAADNEATDPAGAPESLYAFRVYAIETYAPDDGSAESAMLIELSDALAVKAYTPGGYPARLSAVSVYVTSVAGYVADYEVIILADETGGTPEDAVEAWTSGPITEVPPVVPDGEWVEFDVLVDMRELPLASGTWLVGVRWGVVTPNRGPFVGIDLSVTDDPASYAYGIDWVLLNDLGMPGQYMFRAEGYY